MPWCSLVGSAVSASHVASSIQIKIPDLDPKLDPASPLTVQSLTMFQSSLVVFSIVQILTSSRYVRLIPSLIIRVLRTDPTLERVELVHSALRQVSRSRIQVARDTLEPCYLQCCTLVVQCTKRCLRSLVRNMTVEFFGIAFRQRQH